MPYFGQRLKVFLLACTLIMLTFPLGAEETNVSDLPKEAVKALYLAQKELKKNNFDSSIKILTDYMAAAKEPIPLPAYKMLSHAWYQKGDKENTRQIFKKAYDAFPENIDMLTNYTVLTYETGHYVEAGQLFEKLFLAKGGSDWKILYQAAGIYFQAEELGEAKRVLTQLLTSQGEPEARWYEDMIALCIELQHWKEAETWAKKFLERQPGHAKYWRLLAQKRLDREEYESAASALEIAYRLEEPKPGEWLDLSELYLYLNAPLMALRRMEVAYGDEIPTKSKIRMARIYASTQRFDKAIQYLDEAFNETPSADFLFLKGRLLYDAMRFNEAITVLDQCVQMDPKFGDAYILAGFAAWNIKEYTKARSAFAGATILPKYRAQANDAVSVLDDLMAAMSEEAKLE